MKALHGTYWKLVWYESIVSNYAVCRGLPEDAVDEEDEDIDENDPKAIEAAEKRLEERAGEHNIVWLPFALGANTCL